MKTYVYKPAKYDTLGTIDNLNEVFDCMRKATGQKVGNFLGVKVKLGSLRLLTFLHKGVVCSKCGLVADNFAVERDPGAASRGGGYHLNLYSGKGEKRVLFTHDHSVARSLGGKDKLFNCTTMCSPCNFLKSLDEQKELQERRMKALG